jgi:hypothetical protein
MNAKAELEKEQRVLEQLLKDQEAIEAAIARAKRRVAACKELLDDTETGELVSKIDLDLGGLTDVCRTAMRASRKEWMTTAEIQQAVKELGFPLNDYKAPAASITTTVNRLVDAGEVAVDRRSNPGATEYKWVGPNWGASRSLANALDDEARDKARLSSEAKRIAAVHEAVKRSKK